MDSKYTNEELIEKWINNELSDAELIEFEKKMETDTEFKKDAELSKDIAISIDHSGQEDLRKKLQKTESNLEQEDFFSTNSNIKTMKPQNEKSSIGKWIGMAAAVLLLLGAAMFLLNQNDDKGTDPVIATTDGDPKEAFKKYYKPDKKEVAKLIAEYESLGFADPEKAQKDSLSTALKLYSENKFEEARVLLSAYITNYPKDNVANLYMGLCLLQQSEYAKASRFLEDVVQDDKFQQNTMAKWYLGLCYSQFGSKQGLDKTRTIMNELANTEYHQEARNYLSMMDN